MHGRQLASPLSHYKPHVTYPKAPLLEEKLRSNSFTVTFPPETKTLIDRARLGQGFIAGTSLITGESFAIPAQNKNDGIPQVIFSTFAPSFSPDSKNQKRTMKQPMDKEGKPITPFVESTQQLGHNTGDLHTYAVAIKGWGTKGGVNGEIVGWSFYKAGPGVRLLKEPLPTLIPSEYHIFLTAPARLEFVDDKRQVFNIPFEEIIGFDDWLAESKLSLDSFSTLDINKMDADTYLKLIEVCKKDYIKRVGPFDENNIKFFKTLSASQNGFAIKYDPLYRLYVKTVTNSHGSHSMTLLREAPLQIAVPLYNGLMIALGKENPPLSLGEFIALPILPRGQDMLHFNLEMKWLSFHMLSLIESYFKLLQQLHLPRQSHSLEDKIKIDTAFELATRLKSEFDDLAKTSLEMQVCIWCASIRDKPIFHVETLDLLLDSIVKEPDYLALQLTEFFKEIYCQSPEPSNHFSDEFKDKLNQFLLENLTGKNTSLLLRLFPFKCFTSKDGLAHDESLLDYCPKFLFLKYLEEEDIFSSSLWNEFNTYNSDCQKALINALYEIDEKHIHSFINEQILLGNYEPLQYLFMDDARFFWGRDKLEKCLQSAHFSLPLFRLIFAENHHLLNTTDFEILLSLLPKTATPDHVTIKGWLEKGATIHSIMESKDAKSELNSLKKAYLSNQLAIELENPPDIKALSKMEQIKKIQDSFYSIINTSKEYKILLASKFTNFFLKAYHSCLVSESALEDLKASLNVKIAEFRTAKTFLLRKQIYPKELLDQLAGIVAKKRKEARREIEMKPQIKNSP